MLNCYLNEINTCFITIIRQPNNANLIKIDRVVSSSESKNSHFFAFYCSLYKFVLPLSLFERKDVAGRTSRDGMS